jgi:hypothetical protein
MKQAEAAGLTRVTAGHHVAFCHVMTSECHSCSRVVVVALVLVAQVLVRRDLVMLRGSWSGLNRGVVTATY